MEEKQLTVDNFIKEWRKENNTEDAIYSSYHMDAMEAYAERYHQSKVEAVTDEKISEEVDKLPYTLYVDDGQYNDGRIDGFQLGIMWLKQLLTKKEE